MRVVDNCNAGDGVNVRWQICISWDMSDCKKSTGRKCFPSRPNRHLFLLIFGKLIALWIQDTMHVSLYGYNMNLIITRLIFFFFLCFRQTP